MGAGWNFARKNQNFCPKRNSNKNDSSHYGLSIITNFFYDARPSKRMSNNFCQNFISKIHQIIANHFENTSIFYSTSPILLKLCKPNLLNLIISRASTEETANIFPKLLFFIYFVVCEENRNTKIPYLPLDQFALPSVHVLNCCAQTCSPRSPKVRHLLSTR